MNNIALDTPHGQIVLDCRVKTRDGQVAENFICEKSSEKTCIVNAKTSMTNFQKKKDINELYAELGHASEAIAQVTGKAMNLKLTGIFISCEDFALGKAKNGWSEQLAC